MPRIPRTASLSAKLGAIGTLLLVLTLGSIGLTLWVTWQLEGGAAAVNEAGRLRMQAWRMAEAAGSGDNARLGRYAVQFDASLELLRTGDPARPLFVPGSPATRSTFDTVRLHWRELRGAWTGPRPQDVPSGMQAEALVKEIDAYVGAIEQQLSRWTAVLTVFQLGLMGLAIAGGVTLLYAAYVFVFNPLARLREGLARAEQGDLDARVDVDSDDEFGEVADGFNRMAGTLQGFTRDLEQRVRDKTETLQAERERLALLYDASAFVGRAASLQGLAQGFARRLREAGRADASLVRWFDASRDQHVLLASDCLPAEMLDHERCLKPGDCLCGSGVQGPGASAALAPAAGGGRVRVVPLIAEGRDAAPGLCERFGFSALVTIPVRMHDQWIGEVSLLYRGLGTVLSDDDRAMLDSLASHLASGMESLRASALEREAAVAEERALLARELHDSIAQSLAFLKIQSQLLRTAMQRQDDLATSRAMQELDAGLHECTADVRELLVHFRTRTNSDDIVPALRTTLQKFEHQTGLPAHLQVHGAGTPLPPDVQVQLLHVVQEALSNVRKHAKAAEVWVDVQQHPVWRIEVRDNGRGFDRDAAAAADETHVGLRIMRERAAGIGARVEVDSHCGHGTRVVVTLAERESVDA
jgi:two-component system, NarL family, nitrate/nitrite sensor histidine kinase NarX